MTKYQNSECEEHRNAQTSAPVCVVCMEKELASERERADYAWRNARSIDAHRMEFERRMNAELERLRFLAQASLDARDKEAKAFMSLENAQENFHRFDAEANAHEKAMIEASEADRALREALATP